MHDYQNMAYQFGLQTPFSALFIGLGLGKTVISLTLAIDLLMAGEVKKVLIIAPLKVANRTWPDEIATWDHTCMVEYSVLTGNPAERARKCQSRAGIHIINRENVEWLVNHFKKKWPYDMVIIDESSSFKDHTSNRFKALRNVRRYMVRMLQLTATPATETYEHLFAQVFLLDEGQRFGRHITKFRDAYFKHNPYSRKYTLLPGMKEEITDKISDICLVMEAEDYLDIEKPLSISVPVHLDDKTADLYNQMQEDFMIEILDSEQEEVIIEAKTAATLSAKLLQMASGVIYDSYLDLDAETLTPKRHTNVHVIHDLKLEALEKLVEETDGQNLLVAYHFKSSLDRLTKRFPKAVVMDKAGKAVTPWNAGKIKMMFIHPQSGGHGLNLQKGGHILVFFDIPWSLECYLQLIGRLARQGQKALVRVYHLVTSGTIDEQVVFRLKEKLDTQEWLFNRLKAMHRKLRKRLLAAVQDLL